MMGGIQDEKEADFRAGFSGGGCRGGHRLSSPEPVTSVGRETSRIKGVCRRTRLTPKLPRPATPVGVCKCVTILKFRYKEYTGNQIPLETRGVLRDTKCVTGEFEQ